MIFLALKMDNVWGNVNWIIILLPTILTVFVMSIGILTLIWRFLRYAWILIICVLAAPAIISAVLLVYKMRGDLGDMSYRTVLTPAGLSTFAIIAVKIYFLTRVAKMTTPYQALPGV